MGAWNVRTLMDREEADRPMRRTALVAKELERYRIDIAALSETRFPGEGQLKEVGSGYTFFWSGRSSEERRESGVGFAIRNKLVNKLSSLPKGVNDRLMSLRIPISKNRHAVFVSAYRLANQYDFPYFSTTFYRKIRITKIFVKIRLFCLNFLP